jgi:hypothetical protein
VGELGEFPFGPTVRGFDVLSLDPTELAEALLIAPEDREVQSRAIGTREADPIDAFRVLRFDVGGRSEQHGDGAGQPDASPHHSST